MHGQGLLGNTGFAAVFIGISIALNLLTSVVLSRFLSEIDFGKYYLYVSYSVLITVFLMPGNTMSIQKAALKDFDPMFKIELKRSTISGLIVLIAILLYFFSIEHTPSSVDNNIFLCALLAGFTVVGVLDRFDPFIIGKQEFGKSRMIGLLQSMFIFVTVGIAAYTTNSFQYSIISYLMCRFIVTISGVVIALRMANHIHLGDVDRKELTELGNRFTIVNMLGQTSSQVDKLILGTLDPRLLAAYTVGMVIPSSLKNNIRLILAIPIAYLGSMSLIDNIKHLKSKYLAVFISGIFIAMAFWLVMPHLLGMLYGQNYVESIRIAQVAMISLPFVITGRLIIGLNCFNENGIFTKNVSIGRQICQIILLFAIAPGFGIYGVAWSIVSIEVIVGTLYAYKLFKTKSVDNI